MRISPEPISADDWDDHDWRDRRLPLQIDLERRSVPLLQTEVVMWEGSDGESSNERMMPQLGRDHSRQTHLHGESRERTRPHLAEILPPASHLRRIKVTSAAQRFLAQ